MKKILIFSEYYYPGFKSGGPQQSIMNLTDVFGNQFRFYIYTHNHDMGESEPYTGVISNQWNRIGNTQVYYSSEEKYSLKRLCDLANGFDIVYICEPYHHYSYAILLLKKIKRIDTEIIMAPMGAFSEGALKQKFLKKYIFWKLIILSNVSKTITWSFTSETEKEDAIDLLGVDQIVDYAIAEDLPRKYVDYSLNLMNDARKTEGSLKVVFLSRICEMKNLMFVLRIMSRVTDSIEFDIYGTIEDKQYWEQCLDKIEHLPININCSYKGIKQSEEVIDTLLKYDVFILPTLGENFGHVIYEALMSGCVPIISNRTPWNDINVKCCGAVLSLEDPDSWVLKLHDYFEMDPATFNELKINAMNYAKQKYIHSIESSGYPLLFNS